MGTPKRRQLGSCRPRGPIVRGRDSLCSRGDCPPQTGGRSREPRGAGPPRRLFARGRRSGRSAPDARAGPRCQKKDSVRPGTLGLRAVAKSLHHDWMLRRRLQELRPEVLHTSSLKAALHGGVDGRLAGIPVIWHIRDRTAPGCMPMAGVRMLRCRAPFRTSSSPNLHSTRSALRVPRRSVVVTNTLIDEPIQPDALPDLA